MSGSDEAQDRIAATLVGFVARFAVLGGYSLEFQPHGPNCRGSTGREVEAFIDAPPHVGRSAAVYDLQYMSAGCREHVDQKMSTGYRAIRDEVGGRVI